MRQTIGGTWLLSLIIVFILLFVAYIILMIDYSQTVKIKNEVISMVEKYEGLNDQSIGLINRYLLSINYGTQGECSSQSVVGVYGAYDLTSDRLEEVRPGAKYYYCVKKYEGANISNFYQVSFFYKFNLPVIGNTAGFIVRGTTANFQSKDNSDYSYTVEY